MDIFYSIFFPLLCECLSVLNSVYKGEIMNCVVFPLEIFHILLGYCGTDNKTLKRFAMAFPLIVHDFLSCQKTELPLFLQWIVNSASMGSDPKTVRPPCYSYTIRKEINVYFLEEMGLVIKSVRQNFYLTSKLGFWKKLGEFNLNLNKKLWHHNKHHLVLHESDKTTVKHTTFDLSELNDIKINVCDLQPKETPVYCKIYWSNTHFWVCQFCYSLNKDWGNGILKQPVQKTYGNEIFSGPFCTFYHTYFINDTCNIRFFVKKHVSDWYPCGNDKILIKLFCGNKDVSYLIYETLNDKKKQVVLGMKHDIKIKSPIIDIDLTTLMFIDSTNKLYHLIKRENHWKVKFIKQLKKYIHPVKCPITFKIHHLC